MVSSLSLVLPMYNEEENIERMVEGCLGLGAVVAHEVEVVIVNDASTDKSGEIADRLASEHPEVRVIHHPKNRKLGGTLRTGFAAASKEYVLYMDSDLPIKMDDIPPAFALLDGADMVIGYRISRAEGVRRAVMSYVYNRMIRLSFGLKVRDVNFSFKLFKRTLLDKITLCSEGSFIDAEFLIEATRAGCRIREHGFNYYPREKGVSNLSGMDVVLKILGEMSDYKKRRREAVFAAREEYQEH